MEAAINSLPEYQRAMIVMYHAENLSYDEIAALWTCRGNGEEPVEPSALMLRTRLSNTRTFPDIGQSKPCGVGCH